MRPTNNATFAVREIGGHFARIERNVKRRDAFGMSHFERYEKLSIVGNVNNFESRFFCELFDDRRTARGIGLDVNAGLAA